MPLSLKKWGTSAVYGLVDIATEYVDKTQALPASGTFQNSTDIQRVIAVAGGAGAAYLSRGRMSEYGETVAVAATPLLEKSVANMVLSLMGNPTRFAAGGARSQILVRKNAAPGAGRAPGGAAGTFY